MNTSGGALTEYTHNLSDIKDWARQIERHNPLLAQQLDDMYDLLDRYDYYLSGDIGEDGIQKAWKKYCDKWINIDTEKVEQVMFEKCLDLVDRMIKGYAKNEDWWC